MRKTNITFRKIKFLIVAVVFIAVGISFLPRVFVNTREYSKTSAVISSIDEHGDSHSVYISYKVDGTEYSDIPLGFYSSKMYVGQRVRILYNRENPGDVMSAGSSRYFVLLFPLVGFCIIIQMFFPFLKEVFYNRKFRERYRPVYAKIDSVYKIPFIPINGRRPFRIHVTHYNENDGQTYEFKSEWIWNDPSGDIAAAGVTELPVYVDRNQPRHYFVDIGVIYGKTTDLT